MESYHAVNATLMVRAAEDTGSIWIPTHTQWVTIYFLQAYIVFFFISWNLAYVRTLIFPLKLLTVAFHEGCHANFCILGGGKVNWIQLDPNLGGVTSTTGGFMFLQLPAGYIGATAIGAALIFAGFDQKASKIAFIPVALYILEIAWWARKDKFVLTHLTANLGVLVLFLLVQHGAFLRFWILMIGVMNVMYTVWDILDDLVFRKFAESDCSVFARMYPWMPSQAWGAVWFAFALSALVAGALGGLVLFKDNFEEQYLASRAFMPM